MRIREIDGIRAFAVMAVVATHYLNWIPYSGAQFGWLGVDLFFVLSGFLITSILLDLKHKDGYFRTFYARRAFRIFPPYFFVLAIYLITSLATHQLGTLNLWTKYVFYYASLLLSQNHEYDLNAVTQAGLSILWSLSVEELFYTVWAPAVRWLSRTGFLILLAALYFGASAFAVALHSHSPLSRFTFYCRMNGLALGSFVAVLVQARRRGPAGPTRADRLWDWSCLGFGLLAAGFFAFTGGDVNDVRTTAIGIPLADLFFASVVYAVVRHAEENLLVCRLLRLRPIRSIGKVSYSLYLVHLPLMIVSTALVARMHLSRHTHLPVAVLGITLSLCVTYAMWYGFEAHSMRLKDRMFPSKAEPHALNQRTSERKLVSASD